MHDKWIKFTVLVAVALCTVLAVALPAFGDAVYHSQHIALVSDTATTVGFVQNIHANGPTIYAQERYVLVGAEPGTYRVTLTITAPELADPVVLPDVATFTTNAVGNGVGKVTFSPADAGGLRETTVQIVWTVSSAGATYQTAPQTVVLD